jgi:ankyrin repeat protein
MEAVIPCPDAPALILWTSAQRGDVHELVAPVETVIKCGSVDRYQQWIGWTKVGKALHVAARNDHAQVVHVLLDALQPWWCSDSRQQWVDKAFLSALQSSSNNAVHALMGAKAGIDGPALCAAVRSRNVDNVGILLAAKADLAMPAVTADTSFMHVAAALPDHHMFVYLLAAKVSPDLHLTMPHVSTPLVLGAVRKGCTASVRALAAAKADLEAHDFHGYTAVYEACASGKPRMIRTVVDEIIRAGVSVTSPDHASPPLELVVRRFGDDPNSIGLVKILLRAKAAVGSGTFRSTLRGPRSTDFGLVCNALKSKRVFQLLVRAKVDVDAQDEWGRTPLHIEAYLMNSGASRRVSMLVHAKADVNRPNRDGYPALSTAMANHANVREPPSDVIRILLAAKADVNCVKWHRARWMPVIESMLLQAQADAARTENMAHANAGNSTKGEREKGGEGEGGGGEGGNK